MTALLLLALPLFGQRLASDFEIAQMEKQLARARDFEGQLSGRLNLGDVRMARNETALARAEYTKALQLAQRERKDARGDGHLARYANATSYAALAQAKLGRDAESFALLEESARYASDDAETWNLYASAMRILDYPRKAIAAARNAVAIAAAGADRLDLAVYQHALATALVEEGESEEAETLLETLIASLRSGEFATLQREVARAESFEVYSSARGDVAAYVSLLNRAQLRLASLYERRGDAAAARAQYERVLEGRSDDATALAALGRLAASDAERERRYAEAFEANPFSMALVREYQRHLRSHTPVVDDSTTGGAMRKALLALERGELRSARATLDALNSKFPQNETLRVLRREAEGAKEIALPSATPAAAELRALLEGFERLTPEQRVALDRATYASNVQFEGDVFERGHIDGVPFRFSAPVQFHGDFDVRQPLELTYRILGASGEALLVEPLGVRWQSHRSETPRREPRGETVAPERHRTKAAAGAAALLEEVLLKPLANEVVLRDGTRIPTAETPIAAAFLDGELYILARDARVLQHGTTRIPLSADPAFLKSGNGRLYVYARTAGVLEEIENDRVTRRVRVAPFASDLEISGTTAYLAYPREGRIRTVDLGSMKAAGELAVGAIPVDLDFAGGGTALTARILAVADPSSKRVWLTESTQSTAKAVARGFLRGFLGMGLFGDRGSQFPTGVDRVVVAGKHWLAYDSSSGTLYRFTRKNSTVVATGIAPGSWTVSGDTLLLWDGTSVAEKRLQ